MRKFMIIVSVAFAMLIMSACGGNDCTTSTSTPKPSTKSAIKKGPPVEVFPAVGVKHGVKAHGKSATKNKSNYGLTYTCKAGFKTVRIPFGQTVEYNGVVIKYDVKYGEYTAPGDDTSLASITLTFKGETTQLKARTVSMIIDTLGVIDTKKDYFENTDQYVVNVSPNMFSTGVTMDPANFDFVDSLMDIRLCLEQTAGGPFSPPQGSSSNPDTSSP